MRARPSGTGDEQNEGNRKNGDSDRGPGRGNHSTNLKRSHDTRGDNERVKKTRRGEAVAATAAAAEEEEARRPDPAARQPQDGERVKGRAGGAAQEISAGHRWNLVYPTSPRTRPAERGDSAGGTAAGAAGAEGGRKDRRGQGRRRGGRRRGQAEKNEERERGDANDRERNGEGGGGLPKEASERRREGWLLIGNGFSRTPFSYDPAAFSGAPRSARVASRFASKTPRSRGPSGPYPRFRPWLRSSGAVGGEAGCLCCCNNVLTYWST